MKNKSMMLVVAGMAMSLSFSACGNKETKEAENATEQTTAQPEAGVQFTCEMHPEIVTNKPGECPTCGMALIKKEAAPAPEKKDSTKHE